MGNNTMAWSLIFNVIDGASAKIREITSLMAAPTAAAAALGDAAEASSIRQVSSFQRARDALQELSAKIAEPTARMVEFGKAAGEASEKFAKSFAGLGAIAAEGFAAKDVAQQEEFFRRLEINTGMAKSAMEDLREAIAAAGNQYGVSRDQMLAAFQSYRALGGDPRTFSENAGTVAAMQQATGMAPENAGLQLASMQRLGITDPKQVLQVIATMNEQLGRVPERMDAAAEASNRLVASMQSLHMSGAQGALALNAVYAVAARSMGGNARAARTATDSWLTSLADRGYQNQLAQGLGERITDANGFIMDPRVIMQKMAQKYADVGKLPGNQQAVAYQRLNALFGDDAAHMFRSVGGEIQSTGRSSTLDAVLGAKGNSADFLHRATDASETLTGSLNRLRNAMDHAAEAVLTKPINMLVDVLNSCNGAIADVVIGLAGLVAVGTGLNWVTSAVKGFRLMWGVLSKLPSVIGFVVDLYGRLIFGVVNVAKAFASAIVPVIEFGAALLANPITWIVAGIALIGFGIYELAKHWKAVWSALPAPVQHVLSFIGGGFMKLSKALGINWEKIGEVVSGAISSIRKIAAPVFDWISDKLGWIFAKLGQAASWAGSFFGGSGDAKGDSGAGSGSDSGTGGGSPWSGWLPGGDDGASGSARAHNVGNLRNPGGHGFQAFATDQAGALAMAHQLQLYANRDGLHSIAQIISKYAPRGENNTGAYIADVARRMGVSASAALDLNNNGTLGALMHAMIHHEQGHDVLSMSAIGAVLAQGGAPANLNGKGSSVQLAARGGALGPAKSHSVLAPSSIYGPSTGGAGAAAPGMAFADSDGSAEARAHLTITIEDDHRRTRTRLSHSSNMEAELDRGHAMMLKWG